MRQGDPVLVRQSRNSHWQIATFVSYMYDDVHSIPISDRSVIVQLASNGRESVFGDCRALNTTLIAGES